LRAKLNARAGKKEGGWGEGIFARSHFSATSEFHASETGAPLNFVGCKISPPNFLNSNTNTH
jgi:hypothetical protein